jgi:phosphatidylinositol glycan class A protein
VARRTERVYKGISGDISPQEFYGYYPGEIQEAGGDRIRNFSLIDRLKRYYGCGVWAGKLFCLCVVIDFLIYTFLEMWFPRATIDIARSWPKKLSEANNTKIERERLGSTS